MFVVFIAWFFLGFTATHAFPISLVRAILGYLFSGFKTYKWQLDKAVERSLSSTWQGVKSEVETLSTSNSVYETNDREEARKLNRLDSQYWLILKAIELLSTDTHVSNRSLIDWKLHELDEERSTIRRRLKPLRRRYYRRLDRIQNSWNTFHSFLTLEVVRRSKEFDETEKILNSLDNNYVLQSPSRENIQKMLEVLDEIVSNHPRFQSLHNTSRLLSWVYSHIEGLTEKVSEDPQYKEFPVRAIRGRPCYHLPYACRSYPRVEKAEDQETILFFKTIEEAEAHHLNLCGTCKRMRRGE